MGSRRRSRIALVAGLVAAVVLGGLLLLRLVPGLHASVLDGRTAASATRGPGPPAYVPVTPSGRSSPPAGPLTVVGLGDSVPAAANCRCAGFVEQLGTMLKTSTHRPVVVRNDAVSGWTTADVAQDLTAPATRSDLSHADLVVIEVGANDFDLDRVDDPTCFPAASSPCWSQTVAELRDGLSHIVSTIRAVDREPEPRIAVAGYWNVTVDGAVGRQRGEGFVSGSDELTRLVNQAIADVAHGTGALYVDAYAALKGEQGDKDPTANLLADGDHPNAQGHTLLAQELYDTLAGTDAITAWRAG